MTSESTIRQPKGIPAGGQFATTTHAEPDLELGEHSDTVFTFDHQGSPFEVDHDGGGRYTVYGTDGEPVCSFTALGDPEGHESLEESAVAALVEQHERLDAVSAPGSRVVWTDPDGGEKHSGKVIASRGEIIAVALDSGGQAEVFGNELAIDQAATQLHRSVIATIDTPVVWTDPDTGEKVSGRSLGDFGGGNFAFEVPGERGFRVVKPHEVDLAPSAPPAPPMKLAETHRRIRGHNFYAPKAIMRKVPALGTTDGIPFEEKKFHLHYFTGGASNWYIAEVDPDTGRAFGLMDPSGRGEGSWGYVSLPELEAYNPSGYRVIERDCYFSQGNLTHVTGNN